MDFGDILNQWDDLQKSEKTTKKQSQVSHKKANAPTKEEKELARQGYSYEEQMDIDSKKVANPMEVWLRRYGVVDKDAAASKFSERTKMENREYLKNLRPEDRIDLHGLTREAAWQRLDSFVSESKKRGYKKILIIHGKGIHSNGSDPVLGAMVREFIEEDKRLGSSGHPDKNHGGNGATWVIIRQ